MLDEESIESGPNSKHMVDFDIVLKHAGQCGKYQVALVLLAYYVGVPCGMHQVGAVFLAAIPDHRCWLPGVDGELAYGSVDEDLILNATIPYVDGAYSKCRRYNYTPGNCTDGTFDCLTRQPRPKTVPCEKYRYDTSVYESTVTTEWDMVCDRLIVGTTVTAVYYLGILLSSIVGGNIADIFGRRPTMVVGQICVMAVGIGCAFSPTIYTFAATRFFLALFLMASYVSSFVYGVEITAGKWRTIAGVSFQAAFSIGLMILSGLAYRWNNWRDLQLAMLLVSLPCALLWFLIPESPRWLFTKGKSGEAKRISRLIAQRNGRKLPPNIWPISLRKGSYEAEKRHSPLELFRRPRMRLLTVNIMFNWFVISLVYYGLSLNVGRLAGNDYVNNTLNGVMELISFPIVMYTMDKFGRRPVLSFSLLIGGLACLGSTLANLFADGDAGLGTLGTVLGLVGKLAVSGSFAIIYNYTAELYPTVVRSTAVGTGSMAARVGSIFTPYTLQLQYSFPWLTGVRIAVTVTQRHLANTLQGVHGFADYLWRAITHRWFFVSFISGDDGKDDANDYR